MKIASSFYGMDGFIAAKASHHPFLAALATYGNLPGQILSFGAGALWLFTFYRPSWQSVRKGAFTIALISLIGSGIAIHTVLKENYGRPRPRAITEFGGTARFRTVYAPSWQVASENDKSFPSGHVAMGTLFISLGLIGWKERSYSTMAIGFLLGIPLTVMLSYARIAQGAHFLSDVLASFVGMWTLSVIIIMILYPEGPSASSSARHSTLPRKKQAKKAT